MADINSFFEEGIKSYIEQSFLKYSKSIETIFDKNFDTNLIQPLFISDISLYKNLILKNKLKSEIWGLIYNLIDQKINQLLFGCNDVVKNMKNQVIKYTQKIKKSNGLIEQYRKLIKEKNEEIKKLRILNQNLERESYLDNKNNLDLKKYLNEIKRLKNINTNLEDDLKYYKDINKKYIENDKKRTKYESDNAKLQNLIQKKNEEIDEIKSKQKKLEEENKMLERQLINSKGKLGEVLNELAEVESKCVYLEEEQRQMKKNKSNGGKYDC